MKILKLIIPLVVLVVGGLVTIKMIESRPDIQPQPRVQQAPLIRTVEVSKESLRLAVTSQGTVVPRSETSLIPEVSGKVIFVDQAMRPGGFFEEGQKLVAIDSRDFELAMIQAETDLAQAKLQLAQEEAEAEVARKEWEELGTGEASPLVLREPQLERARAAVNGAEAVLERARRNLERTEIHAPFAGRVREESVDLGQYVTVGTPIAQIYAVDFAEIRLPIPDEEVAFVNMPLDYRGASDAEKGPPVALSANFGGKEYVWQGRIVRTEGEIDPETRMLYVVARVADPYGRSANPNRPPLAVGLFVEAEIQGRRVQDVVVLPRLAIRGEQTVYVVDDEQRLRYRDVEILRSEEDRVIISSGLQEGEQVCISPLETAVDGMKVRILEGASSI